MHTGNYYTIMKLSVIFGTRPEAIKLAPLILRLRKTRGVICSVCVTAQHREMLDQVLNIFQITPDVDLNIMRLNQTLPDLTARLLIALGAYLKQEKPDVVIVQGDTTTAFVGALASFYANIPVAHVEAGLRTGNMRSPWPEEANRVLTSRIAEYHFAPTQNNRDNLIREGIPEDRIFVTGNTVLDALMIAVKKVRRFPPVIPELDKGPGKSGRDGGLVLITGHRRENFGDGLVSICKAIMILAKKFPDLKFVYPVHMNPNVRNVVMGILDGNQGGRRCANIHLIEPVAYLPFVSLMDRCRLILTDSGGIQEEAPSLGKPVIVMRENTERPEAVSAGTAILVGTDTSAIVREVSRLLTDGESYRKMAQAHNPYGDGRASSRILDILLHSRQRSKS